MLATPIAPTSSATAPSPRNRVSSAPLVVGLGGEHVRGLGDVDLAGVFRVGLRAEQVIDRGGGGLGIDGADVDLRRVPVEAQVLLRGGEADQDRRVDLRG